MKIIDGKKTAEEIKNEIKAKVEAITASGAPAPHLVAILVGDDPASKTYVSNKDRACREVGFNSTTVNLPADISEEKLLEEVAKYNSDDNVNGVIVQLPLPKHIDEMRVINAINPDKDVDGFHPINMGKMLLGESVLLPATPAGILELIKRYEIETSGKHCVIVGRSNIVGKPLSNLLARRGYPGDCTVTICHSRTQNLAEITRQADILIAAIGVPHFITADMVKEGVVVIDVGINRIEADTKSGFRLAGDVHYDEVAPKSSYVTPVPGGVGPMTIVSLLLNTLSAAGHS